MGEEGAAAEGVGERQRWREAWLRVLQEARQRMPLLRKGSRRCRAYRRRAAVHATEAARAGRRLHNTPCVPPTRPLLRTDPPTCFTVSSFRSTGISLYYQMSDESLDGFKGERHGNDFLVNLIDSPGELQS